IAERDREVGLARDPVEPGAPVRTAAAGALRRDHQEEPLPRLEPRDDLRNHPGRVPPVHRDPPERSHQWTERAGEQLVLAEELHPDPELPAQREHQHEVPVGGVRCADQDAGVLVGCLLEPWTPATERPVRARQRPTYPHHPNLRQPGSGSGYPFTEPEVSPRTKNRCREKNTTSGRVMDRNAPAVSSSTPCPWVPSSCCSCTITVVLLGRRNSFAISRSFHTQRNCRVANAAIAGIAIGATSSQNVWKWLAPSIFADSTTEYGSVAM